MNSLILDRYLFDFHEFHGTVESAWHRSPVLVGGLLVIDIYHIDFLHLAPLYSLTVEFCDAVGRQVGNLDAEGILALVERILTVEDIWYSPSATYNYFMAKYSDPTLDTFVKKKRTSNLWTRAVYYEGLMALYEIDPQQRYLDYTDKWADYHKWTARGSVNDTDADNQCCQQTYMDRYVQTGGKKDLSKVKENLDHQMGTNRVNYWTWIDAIQMAMPAYAKYAKITGERKYLDYAMNSYKWSRDTLANGLFNKKEGLWWRDKDYVPPYKEKDGSNCYWSRGNGWVYAALVRVMETLPKTDKYYQYLKKDFISMSQAILKCQRKDGYWNVSLVCPANYGGPEMTGTGLFLYGMAWGVQQGILPRATYQKAMDKAWKALAASVHEDGFIGYNQGTGKEPSAGQPVTFTSVPDFEDYGTGCLLLGAAEYYKLVKAKK